MVTLRDVERDRDYVVVGLEGEFAGERLTEGVRETLEEHYVDDGVGRIRVDLHEVRFIDLEGVAALLSLRRESQERGKRVHHRAGPGAGSAEARGDRRAGPARAWGLTGRPRRGPNPRWVGSGQGKEDLEMTSELRAAYPNMERARRAIDALERAGVDGGHIALAGDTAEEAATDTDTRVPDERVTRRVGKRAIIGALAGAVVGTVVGLLLGVALSGGALWGAVMGGFLVGGTVGGILGGVSSLDMSEAWELTQHPARGGPVHVSVHSEDPDELARAEEALLGESPISIHPERVRPGETG